MRARPLAPWYTALVCMVPPCIGCGWPNTTAARGGDPSPPVSINASSRPAGPFNSRGMSNVAPSRGRLGGRFGNEWAGGLQHRAGFRDDADVAGTAQLRVPGAGNQAQILQRAIDGHD